ncbi:P22 phage major capsid protein family protein [Desulfovibrio sp.]|uniref:P22 phage major capsid protein family protein n=1 Tax=Desulfovibrio sp. TaxID=885 RepID=UPI003FED5086
MANTLNKLMPELYAALDIVSREMVGFIPAVAVNAAPTGAAKGESITIPVTPTTETHDITPGQNPDDNGDQEIGSVTMTISKSKYASVRWNGEEQLGVSNSGTYTASLDGQVAQAMRALANEVDADLAALYAGASRAYGTPGTTPFESSIKDVAQMRKILADNGAPMTDLQLVIDTAAGANLRSLGQLTKANEADTDATLRRGLLLNISGFNIRESGQIVTHAAGSFTGDALVNNSDGYAKGATTIAVDGATAIALKAGDLVKFNGDNVNYVVASDASATPITLAAPGLRGAVANDATVTALGSYAASLAFDRNALQLIARTPAMPQGGDRADDVTVVTDPVSGISFQVAVYREYRRVRYEVGLAWGVKLIKPEHVAILMG